MKRKVASEKRDVRPQWRELMYLEGAFEASLDGVFSSRPGGEI